MEDVKPEESKGKSTWRQKRKKKKRKPKKQRQTKPSGRQHGGSSDSSDRKNSKPAENNNHSGICLNNAQRTNYQGRRLSKECNGEESDSDEESKRRNPKLARGHYAGIAQQDDDSMSVESHQTGSNEVDASALLVAQEHVPELCQLLDVSFL